MKFTFQSWFNGNGGTNKWGYVANNPLFLIHTGAPKDRKPDAIDKWKTYPHVTCVCTAYKERNTMNGTAYDVEFTELHYSVSADRKVFYVMQEEPFDVVADPKKDSATLGVADVAGTMTDYVIPLLKAAAGK